MYKFFIGADYFIILIIIVKRTVDENGISILKENGYGSFNTSSTVGDAVLLFISQVKSFQNAYVSKMFLS